MLQQKHKQKVILDPIAALEYTKYKITAIKIPF